MSQRYRSLTWVSPVRKLFRGDTWCNCCKLSALSVVKQGGNRFTQPPPCPTFLVASVWLHPSLCYKLWQQKRLTASVEPLRWSKNTRLLWNPEVHYPEEGFHLNVPLCYLAEGWDGDSKFFRNVGTILYDHTTSHHRRKHCSCLRPWSPHISVSHQQYTQSLLSFLYACLLTRFHITNFHGWQVTCCSLCFVQAPYVTFVWSLL